MTYQQHTPTCPHCGHNGTACAFGPEALARFYALARAEALEDAAKVAFNADHMGSVNLKLMKNRIGNAIRALKEQQHG